MNILSKAIEEVKETLISCGGNQRITLHDENNTIICAEWEEWELDSNYDVVTIYIYQNDRIAFSYQLEETKVSCE